MEMVNRSCPVCGSNDVTYNNICLLEFAACQATSGEQITKVTDGPCPVEEKREGLIFCSLI